ncbi:hypothetical protein [Leuconostoc lactis]|uniref:hypothetical protein n=1 Tax=Leuconostoc lactis TaxID=1246 RepID=UPI003CC72794
MLTVKAIKSPYTKLLMEQFLLSYIDLTDTTILSGLQKNVYPLYDELKELRGLKGVKEHLAYIRDKQDDYSKRILLSILKNRLNSIYQSLKGRI